MEGERSDRGNVAAHDTMVCGTVAKGLGVFDAAGEFMFGIGEWFQQS
jgi:hypothetical protein